MLDAFLNPIWAGLVLHYLHWVALVVLFAASTARYSLVVRGDTDQHRLYQALGINRIALFAIALLLFSGGALVLISGPLAVAKLTRPLLLLKLALFALSLLLLIYPWLFTRRHALIRSYGWVNIPNSIRWLLRLDIVLFFGILFVSLLLVGSGR